MAGSGTHPYVMGIIAGFIEGLLTTIIPVIRPYSLDGVVAMGGTLKFP